MPAGSRPSIRFARLPFACDPADRQWHGDIAKMGSSSLCNTVLAHPRPVKFLQGIDLGLDRPRGGLSSHPVAPRRLGSFRVKESADHRSGSLRPVPNGIPIGSGAEATVVKQKDEDWQCRLLLSHRRGRAATGETSAAGDLDQAPFGTARKGIG
jgi:hypothetical protein